MSATSLVSSPDIDDLPAALAAAEPFADLPAPVLKAIADISMERVFTAGETIVSLGQYDGAEFFFVRRGRLKAAFADESSRAMLIEEVDECEFFGLADAVADRSESKADRVTLTAETDATVLSIEAAGFRALLSQRPSLTRNLVRHFARALSAGGYSPSGDSPMRRVFAALMEHVRRDPISGDWRIDRMPRHRELAEKARTDEAIAANAIAQLIQDGVARRDYPGLVIEDMAEFSRLSS